MLVPFIRNHQFNLINKQVGHLQNTCNTVSDPKVVESVRIGTQTKVLEAFPEASELQQQLLRRFAALNSRGEFQQYLDSLEPFRTEIEPLEEKQLKKLFPKIKKLKVPDLTTVDFRNITYLGWTDIASNRLFIVYRLNGQYVGIEGRYTPTNKKGVCFLCNRQEEVALFSAITKAKPPKASPDYYKAIGNYMCVNSDACNKNITDVAMLEKFVYDVTGNYEA
ncbi:FusB/FusC family EF-G-binding protein [Cohnella terricola]|uniref:Elongation factor G-binding protein n=1 Tax=Cohnella terricola TaxID=1289167 RepID=A0A559JT52_9BACL|nr:FusB/FusC family EF-G-binding protein [Cohnella terricola]TVY03047.1 elongation factor G-binding protein [Cohnella terricola]